MIVGKVVPVCQPCSKVKTPAAQRAVYSPRERPAETWVLHIAALSQQSQQSPRFWCLDGLLHGFFQALRDPIPTALCATAFHVHSFGHEIEGQSKQRSLLLHQAGLLLQVVSLGAFQGLVVSTQTAEMLSTLHHYRVNFRPAACHSRQKHCWLTHLCRFFCSK